MACEGLNQVDKKNDYYQVFNQIASCCEDDLIDFEGVLSFAESEIGLGKLALFF
jgi:hypothetical protein